MRIFVILIIIYLIIKINNHNLEMIIPRNHYSIHKIDNNVYIFGGQSLNLKEALNDFLVFNINIKKWSIIIQETPIGKRYHTSSWNIGNDLIYIWSGVNSKNHIYNDLWTFDIKLIKFRVIIESLLKPTERFSSIVWYDHNENNENNENQNNNIVYIFGGIFKLPIFLFNDLWSYTTINNVWKLLYGSVEWNNQFENLENLPSSRGHSIRWKVKRQLYLLGGINIKELNDFWKFNITKNSWMILLSSTSSFLLFHINETNLQNGCYFQMIWKKSENLFFFDYSYYKNERYIWNYNLKTKNWTNHFKSNYICKRKGFIHKNKYYYSFNDDFKSILIFTNPNSNLIGHNNNNNNNKISLELINLSIMIGIITIISISISICCFIVILILILLLFKSKIYKKWINIIKERINDFLALKKLKQELIKKDIPLINKIKIGPRLGDSNSPVFKSITSLDNLSNTNMINGRNNNNNNNNNNIYEYSSNSDDEDEDEDEDENEEEEGEKYKVSDDINEFILNNVFIKKKEQLKARTIDNKDIAFKNFDTKKFGSTKHNFKSFKKEVDILNSLPKNNRNIPKFYGCHISKFRIGHCTEYSKNEITLTKYLTGKIGPPTFHIQMKILISILNGLISLQKEGLFHRDIKSENILINIETTEAKIIDFGVTTKNIESNQLVGTRNYISPEIKNRKKYDYKSDVYSLSIVMMEILMGKASKTKAFEKMIENLPNEIEEIENEKLRNLVKSCSYENPKLRPGFITIKECLIEISKS